MLLLGTNVFGAELGNNIKKKKNLYRIRFTTEMPFIDVDDVDNPDYLFHILPFPFLSCSVCNILI